MFLAVPVSTGFNPSLKISLVVPLATVGMLLFINDLRYKLRIAFIYYSAITY